MKYDLNEAVERKYFTEDEDKELEKPTVSDDEEIDDDITSLMKMGNEPYNAIDESVESAVEKVMDAYQSANKWLDIIKECVYMETGCVFFSSYIHNLAHTMPVRFDKFGDILHTINLKIPYPATAYIPQEPTDIDGAFTGVFMTLDNIKHALNDFIRVTDESYHGMACAAEGLLNDIESEYPMLYRLNQEWGQCNGDMIKFDKYVNQYVKNKGDLLESKN